MTFTTEWDFPALALFKRIPWPTSADVDAAVQRFARERAPHLESGAYRIQAAGYTIALRMDRTLGTVLVLYVYARRS